MLDSGPIELPVHLTVGDPADAQPQHLGSVHVALRPAVRGDLLDDPGRPVRLVPVDPDDFTHQLADLLDRYATTLRAALRANREVPGAAPHH